MGSVTAWAAMLCTAAIGCTVMQILSPKKGMGEIFKLIVAAFFLCCMVSPLLSMKNILSLDWQTTRQEVTAEELDARVRKQFESQVATALSRTANDLLEPYHIPVAKIEAKMDTDEQGSIYITKVVLYLPKKYRSQAALAKQVLENGLGTDVEVIILTE